MRNIKGQGLIAVFIGIMLVCIVGIAVAVPVVTEIIDGQVNDLYPVNNRTRLITTFHINNTETLSANLSYITITENGTAAFPGTYENISILNSSGELFGSSTVDIGSDVINITGNDTITSNSEYTIWAQWFWENSTADQTMDFIVTNITFHAPVGSSANLTVVETLPYNPAGTVLIRNCTDFDSNYAQHNSSNCIDAANITGSTSTLVLLIPLMIVIAIIVFVIGGVGVRQ